MKDNSKRANKAVLLICIILALEVAGLILGFIFLDLYTKSAQGEYIPEESWAIYEAFEGIHAIIYAIAYIVSIVIFIQWFGRAYKNLHTQSHSLLYNEGWAAGSWFVPILNLYRPYKIMKELYEKTAEILASNIKGFKRYVNTDYVGYWWVLFLITNYVGSRVQSELSSTESTEEIISYSQIALGISIASIFLCLITIKVIKDYSKLEFQLFDLWDKGHEPVYDIEDFQIKEDSEILDDFVVK